MTNILYAIIDRFHLQKAAYRLIPVLIVVYIALAQGSHLFGVSIENRYYRNFLIEGLCFFLLGNWIHCNQDKLQFSNKMLITIMIMSTILCPAERLFMGRDFGVNIVTFPQVTALFLLGVNNSGKFCGSILQKIGTRLSMLVYILHPAVWRTLEAIYRRCGISGNTGALYLMPILVVLLTMCCAVIVSVGLVKIKEKRMAL